MSKLLDGGQERLVFFLRRNVNFFIFTDIVIDNKENKDKIFRHTNFDEKYRNVVC